MGNRLALLDPFYEQTTTMNSETGITVRHEDLLVCEAATPQCPEVFTISEICHQRPDQVQLVRDRGSQFIDTFDEVFRTEGLKILKSPVRTPVANAFAERWIGTIRRELLDRTIIWNQQQLERLATDYIEHYNTHRPHRSLNQRPPLVADERAPADPRNFRVMKSTRCQGLINEYRNAA